MLICRDKIAARLISAPHPNAAVEGFLLELLAPVRGEVLDIGFGTGAHLPYYPSTVSRLTILAPTLQDMQHAQVALDGVTLPHALVPALPEKLDFNDNSFDTVVSLLTLCAVDGLEETLSELRRVLKPGGRFIFLEHGLSDDPQVACWQNLLNPIATLLPIGCYLNREMARLIRAAGFADLDLLAIEGHGMARLDGVMLAGRASPNKRLSSKAANAEVGEAA